MGVSRTGVLLFLFIFRLTRYLQSQICFNAFLFLFRRNNRQFSRHRLSRSQSKGISNYAREINHHSRIKVIKFVNSTVKCNVNSHFTEHEHLKPPFVERFDDECEEIVK